MTQKLPQNQWVKAASEFWLLSLDKISPLLFYLLILFLPTQLGKHFWFSFSYVLGARIDYLSPTLYVTDLLLLALFLTTILRKKIFISPYFSLVVLFLSVGIFFSHSPIIGWYGLAKFLELSFLAWYIVREKINTTLTGLLLSVGIFLESSLAFLQLIRQGSLGGFFYFLGERSFNALTPGIANASVGGELVLRPYATFSHPNMLGGYLVVVMLLIVSLLQGKKVLERSIALLSLALGTIALALSLSRVAIAAWIFVGLGVLVGTYRRRIGKQFLLGALIVLASFILSAIFFPTVLLRILSFPLDQSFTQRAMLAQDALMIFAASPILGVGLGNFVPSLPLVAKQGVVLQPVHNIYLLTAAETGVVGFIIGIFALTVVVRKLWKKWQKEVLEKNKLLFVGFALLVIFFSGFFDHYFLTLQQGQLLFAVVIGFCLRGLSPSDTIQE